MPVTPFHLGPALVVKALGPRWFSLGVFTVVQVGIDVESVLNIVRGSYPIHATLHTVPGSLTLAAVLLLPARYWLPLAYGWLARWPEWALLLSGVAAGRPIPWTAALTRAILWGSLARGVGCVNAPRHASDDALA